MFLPGHERFVVAFLWESRLFGLAFGSYPGLPAGPLFPRSSCAPWSKSVESRQLTRVTPGWETHCNGSLCFTGLPHMGQTSSLRTGMPLVTIVSTAPKSAIRRGFLLLLNEVKWSKGTHACINLPTNGTDCTFWYKSVVFFLRVVWDSQVMDTTYILSPEDSVLWWAG